MFLRLHKLVNNLFSVRSPAAVYAVSLLMLVILCYIDYVTGDYSLIIFYLIPVSLVAWFVSKRSGLVFCLLALAARFIADEWPTSFNFSNSFLHYWNEFIEFLFLMVMSLLFSTLKHTLDTEKKLARTDPLTNAFNRRSFFDLAEYELSRSHRYSHPFSVAYIDLDNFKEINDRQGHHTGDELLITVVNTIRANIRHTDILGRFGGDEFVLLLPETPGDAALAFLQKMHKHLDNAMSLNKWPVSFSIGAVTYVHPPATVDEVIRRADELMYDVKRGGKNRLMHTEIRERTDG